MKTDAGRRLRVLLIEDEPDVRLVLSHALERARFDVRSRPDGESGLAAVRRSAPDVLLLDLQLPGIQGLDLLDQLCREPPASPMQTVVVTARSCESSVRRGLILGAVDIILKPFSSRDLPGRISSVPGLPAPPTVETVAGRLRLHPPTCSAHIEDRTIHLTAVEFMILALLDEARGGPLSRDELTARIWRHVPDLPEGVLEAHLARIESRLGTAAPILRSGPEALVGLDLAPAPA
jgi:DNA-binding response OmpR family regulator